MVDWHPIDTAPKDEFVPVLLFVEGRVTVGTWNSCEGNWSDDRLREYEDAIQPTHWMPLPCAPAMIVGTSGLQPVAWTVCGNLGVETDYENIDHLAKD